MNDSIGILLFKDKQVRLLLALMDKNKEWHISDLAKATNVTYIHTSKFVSKCESVGIITSEKHGRIKRLVLTEKGMEIANSVSTIMEKIKQNAKQVATAAPVPSAPVK